MENWRTFLDELLDGVYALEVQKIGTEVALVRNQLGHTSNKISEARRFRECLRAAMNDFAFEPNPAIKNARPYLILMDLGIEYLLTDEIFGGRCAPLYLNLGDFKNPMNEKSMEVRDELLAKCCLVFLKIIEKWKNGEGVVKKNGFYQKYPFMAEISERWKKELLTLPLLQNPNIVKGIVYLDEWKDVMKKDIVQFFANNINNDSLFGLILSDINRVHGDERYDYSDFLNSCETLHQKFYAVAVSRAPQKIKETGTLTPEPALQQTSDFEMLEGYKTFMKKVDLGGGLYKKQAANTFAESKALQNLANEDDVK